uniref:Zinc finger homeobox protein 3 n=1 Tax=Petromyzon marinus TaxID=7757 RepID=S4R5K8_PETMA
MPFADLEKYASQYRSTYDKVYPMETMLSEPLALPPLPPPPANAQPQPQPQASPKLPTMAPQLSTTPQPTQNQVSLVPPPLDMPLFSPLMMQSLQLPPGLTQSAATSVEALSAELAQFYQQQLDANFMQQQNKRPRTRITDDQLRILRAHFNINNSPSDEQIQEMSERSCLPPKVIKHWFRNTLFKERQRNKDSPYNFSNPPTTSLEELKIMESQPQTPESVKSDQSSSRRSSRTRFSDYQLRVLQDFFDANAYPKDDEIEQLSTLLNLPTRVIVVWFQNARQKARKNYENQGDGKEQVERKEPGSERYIRTGNMSYQCKKCEVVFQRIFDLITHQKRHCYRDEEEEAALDSQADDSIDGVDQGSQHQYASSSGTPGQTSATPPSPNVLEKDKEMKAEPRVKAPHVNPEPKEEREEKPKRAETSLPQQLQQQQPPLKRPAQPASESLTPTQSSTFAQNPFQLPTSSQSQMPMNYQCEQCKMVLPSFELWQEHQRLHYLAPPGHFLHSQLIDQRPPGLDMPLLLFDPTNPLMGGQFMQTTNLSSAQSSSQSASSPTLSTSASGALKRKLDEKPGGSLGDADASTNSLNNSEDQPRDKRLRTTITPEQLEILYQKYLLDSNPTRKMLDHIAHEVGLKKRVVQVWFQNTRARERKGHFRAVGPAQVHRRCPFCRALFKARTALEAHIRSRHWHEAKRAGYNLGPLPSSQEAESSAQMQQLLDDGSMDQHDLGTSQPYKMMSDFMASHESTSMLNKSSDLSPGSNLSPGSVKVEGMDDIESPTLSSTHTSFDHGKIDNDDCSSINTAITDNTTGDEGHNDTDSNSGLLSDMKSSARGDAQQQSIATPTSDQGSDDRSWAGLVSPGMSYSARDNDNEGIVDHSETSSIADPGSPSVQSNSGSSTAKTSGMSYSGDRPGLKRFRTQMSNLQLKVLKVCFNDYRTPTMQECEILGNEIGLPKRVVQVWFQNARAKEKKSKLSLAKQYGIDQPEYDSPKMECTICGVKYGPRLTVRDHVFAISHIDKVRESVGSQLDREKEYLDPSTVRQLMAQQEFDRIKKANEALGISSAQQQQGGFDGSQMQAMNLAAAASSYPGLPPMLLPGMAGHSSLPGFPPVSSALTAPGAGVLSLPTAGIPSPGLPLPVNAGKPLKSPDPQTSNTLTVAATTTKPHPRLEKEQLAEKGKEKVHEHVARKDRNLESKVKSEFPSTSGAVASTSAAQTAHEGSVGAGGGGMDPAQLQALQAALAVDPAALLGGQFLPYIMSGIPPYYTQQIPTSAATGLPPGYLPPFFGMETSFFPYNAALSQAVAAGLSPGSLGSPGVVVQNAVEQRKEPSIGEHERGDKPRLTESKGTDSLDIYVVTVVTGKPGVACRKCQAVFGDEVSALAHQRSLCYAGQRPASARETLVRVPPTDDIHCCLACDATLSGRESLARHLRSGEHRQRSARRAAQYAKEHARVLPHSARDPDHDAASTSQTDATHPADGNRSLSSSSSSSALQNEPAPRGNGGAAAALPLGASTVTSASSRRASGVQTSPPPWDSCSDESESELSRASEDSERPAGSRAPRAVAPLDSGSTGSAQLATDFLRV